MKSFRNVFLKNSHKGIYNGTDLFGNFTSIENRLYNFHKPLSFENFIHLKGTTLRYELHVHNIAHFTYDTFLNFFHFLRENSAGIDTLLINVKSDSLETPAFPQLSDMDAVGTFKTGSNYWCNSLFLCALSQFNIKVVYQTEKVYFFEELIILGEDRLLRYPGDAHLLYKLISTTLKLPPPPAEDVIIYTREEAGSRIILNAAQLAEEIKKIGFSVKIVDTLANLSFRDQALLLNSCKIFISPTGANMTNLLLMNKNICILEVDYRNSWPRLMGTDRLFSKYFFPSFSLVHNPNPGGKSGRAQENPLFDQNYIVDISSTLDILMQA